MVALIHIKLTTNDVGSIIRAKFLFILPNHLWQWRKVTGINIFILLFWNHSAIINVQQWENNHFLLKYSVIFRFYFSYFLLIFLLTETWIKNIKICRTQVFFSRNHIRFELIIISPSVSSDVSRMSILQLFIIMFLMTA